MTDFNTKEIIENTNYLKDIFADMNKRFPQELDFATGRSQFQQEKFMSEPTIAANFKHILKNAKLMRGELVRVIREGIEKKRLFEYKWKDKDTTQPIVWGEKDGVPQLAWHDLDEMEHNQFLNDLAISIKDKTTQLAFFDGMMEALEKKNGKPITMLQFNAEEPVYWERRLTQQLADDVLSRQIGVGGGNLKAARDAASPVLIPGSINAVSNFVPLDAIKNNPHALIEDSNNKHLQSYYDLSQDFVDQITLEKLKLEQDTQYTIATSDEDKTNE